MKKPLLNAEPVIDLIPNGVVCLGRFFLRGKEYLFGDDGNIYFYVSEILYRFIPLIDNKGIAYIDYYNKKNQISKISIGRLAYRMERCNFVLVNKDNTDILI
jgi:hypothetical protein